MVLLHPASVAHDAQISSRWMTAALPLFFAPQESSVKGTGADSRLRVLYMELASNLLLRGWVDQRQSFAYAMVDKNLTVIGNNATLHRWFGDDHSDFVGISLLDIIPELSNVADLLIDLAENQSDAFTIKRLEHNRPDEDTRYLSIHLEPVVEFGFGNILLVILADVTEQWRTEHRLRSQYDDLMLKTSGLTTLNHQLSNLVRRLLPHKVAQKLIGTSRVPKVGGEKLCEATIMFADMRGFTAFAESTEPKRALDILNSYISVIAEGIWNHQGSLIQYAGDLVMAAFNVPDDQPDHVLRGTRATLEIRDSLERFVDRSKSCSTPGMGFGFGVSTGWVTAGYLGSNHRYQYAAVGDTTNVAFHLCARAEAGQVLISDTTRTQLGQQARVRQLDMANLKMRRASTNIYELVGLAD